LGLHFKTGIAIAGFVPNCPVDNYLLETYPQAIFHQTHQLQALMFSQTQYRMLIIGLL